MILSRWCSGGTIVPVLGTINLIRKSKVRSDPRFSGVPFLSTKRASDLQTVVPMTYQRPHILVVCGAACRRAFTACFRHFLEVCSCSSTTDPRPRKRKLALATMTVLCRNAGQCQGWYDPMRWSKVHRREVSNGKEDDMVIVVMRTVTIVANQVEIKQQPRRP